MTAHYEYDQTSSSPFSTLRQIDEGPLLKEVTRGYQLDLQCTQSLEHLISQEKFQPEGLDEYEPENAREWCFRDQVRRVIKELVTVKNHYFSTLTQALTLLQKQEQKITYQATLLEFHNKMNSHKDMQIETFKRIIKGLGFDPESREDPSHQRVKDLQSRMSSVTREEVITRIQQTNKFQFTNKDSKTMKETQTNKFSQSRSSSAQKRNSSTPKEQPMTVQQGSNIIRKIVNSVSNRSRENSTDQRRSSVSRKENGLPQECSSATQRSKGVKKPADRKPFDYGIATSSFAQDVKKILSIKKTPKSPLKPVSMSILNSQRSHRAQSKADVYENLRIESTELPRGVRLVTKTSQNVSRQTTQRSIERHNTDFPCQEKLPPSQRSASLSRSPDSTPNATLHSSRGCTVEDLNMINKKDRTDVLALQKGLKKSFKKLRKRTTSQGKYTDPISCEDQRWNMSHQEIPVRDENPRQRRSKSIGSTPAGIYEVEDITECRIKPVVEKRNNESSIKEMSPRTLIQKQIEAFKKNYDSQSSIGESLLHDINSISYCNQMDLPLAHSDQENKTKDQGKSKPKKLPIQAFGLKDITKTLNSRGNLSARGGSGYVVHTERSPLRDDEKYDFLQRRRSVGKREIDNGKLEVMYGTKTLKRVKNWAPLLTKK